MDLLKSLYQTLQQRKRPEDVAEMILELMGPALDRKERKILEKAAQGSLSRRLFSYTSMAQEFAEAVGCGKQVQKAIEIFELEQRNAEYFNHVEHIEAFIAEISALIHKPVGGNDYFVHRMNRAEREAAGLDLSRRQYNKKWRILRHLEKKLLQFKREIRKTEFQKIAKHGIVHRLDIENFSADLNTACFIAYYNARCNLF